MGSTTSYRQAYVDDCRARIDEQLATYRGVAASADAHAVASFDAVFFANLVLLLDHMFAHRDPAQEGNDGNPCNEVRVLCASLTAGGGVLVPDKGIKLDPARSVLGLQPGETIAVTEADFVRLADAFFAEVERRFGAAEAAA